ncbi:hypothetical protein SCLCIDRAFT_929809 [Scleroderma citrinum Foug A]|uniref:Uncharacterized protein n=1 Tax=Scleroderma citrinum Foug A TaxID=1036808 RepID=A0A0C3DJD1_9AGAM|nr:hypothetical protein SCLCIDRAFT_929809 [Scleroderma citrinum Foug A]
MDSRGVSTLAKWCADKPRLWHTLSTTKRCGAKVSECSSSCSLGSCIGPSCFSAKLPLSSSLYEPVRLDSHGTLARLSRLSVWNFNTHAIVDAVSFSGQITFVILANRRPSLVLVAPAFIACVLFSLEAKYHHLTPPGLLFIPCSNMQSLLNGAKLLRMRLMRLPRDRHPRQYNQLRQLR